jgi:hypothetical protein
MPVVSINTPVVSALKTVTPRGLSRSRSPGGKFKPLLDPGGGLNSETTAHSNGRHVADSEL